MLQNDQIGFVFSVVSLLSFVSLFLTSPSLIQRKIIYSIRIVKNRGNIRSFLQNSYLAIYWISFLTINTSNQSPKPQDQQWWWVGKVSSVFYFSYHILSQTPSCLQKPLFLLIMAWILMLTRFQLYRDIQCWWSEKRKTHRWKKYLIPNGINKKKVW